MILSAQRVMSPHSGSEGFNCFHYRQDLPLTVAPIERFNHPGEVIWQNKQLPIPGNRVRSFVDISAPEDVSTQEIISALEALVSRPIMPTSFASATSRVAIRMNMELSLAPFWKQEALYLVYHLIRVHP